MTQTTSPRVLIVGYGNPGRLDDGLGPAFASAFENMSPAIAAHVEVEIDYQLNIEHAELICGFDIVIFADAHTSCREPFEVARLVPGVYRPEFTSHSVSPEDVVSLSKAMFGAEPECLTLAIRGYDFNEFGQRLSEPARQNLQRAVNFIKKIFRTGGFDKLNDCIDNNCALPGVTDY